MSEGPVATFSGLWAQSVATGPTRPFLIFEAPDGTIGRWTYEEFDEIVVSMAAAFEALGVGPDRGVHLALTNSPTFVAAWLAALRVGSYIVPSDPMATAPELADHIGRTAPAVGLCAASRSERYREAIASCDEPDLHLVEVDEASTSVTTITVLESTKAPGDPGVGNHTENRAPLAPADPGAGNRRVGASDRAAVMFTSGTTGRPKGVVISQANYAFAGTTMAAAARLTADDRQLVVLPLFHANAQYYSFASAIAVGASVALMHTFSASGFVDQAARHGATHASLFAGPMRMILARGGSYEPAADAPGLRLRHCWFAQNLATDQYETLSDWFGCRPRQLYGMTETIPAVLTDSVDDPHCDTMGHVTDGCQVEIHDGDGRACDAGVVGEIVVGGRPGRELFSEYLDDPDTTAASFRSGWFLTGDRASRDDDGRFRFDGRRADVLKVSGENVSVVEVEAALGEHPGVHDVVVVGAPDPIRDEVPVAFVLPAGADPAAIAADAERCDELTRELEDWAAARLGKAKRPHRYIVVDDLPRTSVGKIRKFLLAEAARTAIGPTTNTSSTTTTTSTHTPHTSSAEVPS